MLRRAFTLVELLVVIAIIGILIGLLLPAVQSAREAGRRTQCANNLHNIGIACTTHLDQEGYFPTGGWGWNWIGDPDCSTGAGQPGGWVYNILPFMEYANLHDMGRGVPTAAKMEQAMHSLQVPINSLICPSRRKNALYPFTRDHSRFVAHNAKNLPVGNVNVSRTDYAACAGGTTLVTNNECNGGPSSMKAAETFNWPITEDKAKHAGTYWNGISYVRSTIRSKDVTRGLSHCIMAGEKYVRADQWANGQDVGDNEAIFTGFDNDVYRITAVRNAKAGTFGLSRDLTFQNHTKDFGSAHAAACNFVLCDGSVHTVSYAVDPKVFCNWGCRTDQDTQEMGSIFNE